MDLDALRRQYESMTDEALLEIDRNELKPDAQKVLDQELEQRGIEVETAEPATPGATEEEIAGLVDELSKSEAPDWLEEAVVVYGESVGRGHQPRMREALAVLMKAKIPMHTNVRQEPHPQLGMVAECELLVPFNQQLQAISILDKQLFNAQHEADWRAHFENMTDDELLGLEEDALVGGLRDRAERLIRAWEDELLKRGLAELESE